MAPQRIVPVEDIPLSLWDTALLRLPPALATAYCNAVTAHGLAEVAAARDPNRAPVGGLSENEAKIHFAQAFDGSSARVALAVLDPKVEVARVADALTVLFAGGRIAVLDVPCGAGAFFLSVLAAVAELRARRVLPRHPLDVTVIGGDINMHAAKFAHDLLERIRPTLSDQAIEVSFACQQWDVHDDVNTAALLKRFITDSVGAERTAVVVSNFSGFLKSSGNWQKAREQLKDLFMYCPGNHRTALWLEPKTKAATESLRSWIAGAIRESWRRVMTYFQGINEDEALEQTEAEFQLPLEPNSRSVVRLSVQRFELLGHP